MNKEQSADELSLDLIRVKNMLNSTISMSYPVDWPPESPDNQYHLNK